MKQVLVETSARHMHLSKEHLEILTHFNKMSESNEREGLFLEY